ncbi:hypothetical protein GUJ93_ZPchr0002g26214 [Zizania palustris]|uniref:Homeobox domain-containing protein n=1 Tax=Zizania palustris TaxID=103762 RepID=A0A8J5VB98_ZIZPA|nr:hypothetical protein GUJ93_ZPchr0002g26214 [Zizania palustris]
MTPPSQLLAMELELSLGDSPAPVKITATPTPACMGDDGEGLELMLGVRYAKRDDQQDDQTSCSQPEEAALEGDDDETRPRGEAFVESSSFPRLFAASADQTGSMNSEVCTRGFDVNSSPVDRGTPLSPSSMLEVSTRQAANQVAADDDDNGGGGARKKLRLSKEQSAFLELSFREHSTLTPKQKSDLANRLNLRPRQVEVWFQNRRARIKLKQTEVDCEHLKRYCERLTRENRSLRREVAELRALRTTYPPLYSLHHHLPAAAGGLSSGSTVLRVCPSCDSKLVVVTATSGYSPPSVAAGAAAPAAATTAVSSPQAAGESPPHRRPPPTSLCAGPSLTSTRRCC